MIHHGAVLPTVFWLATWIETRLIHITIDDLLRLEETYPGLVRDIDTCIWQTELVREQMKPSAEG